MKVTRSVFSASLIVVILFICRQTVNAQETIFQTVVPSGPVDNPGMIKMEMSYNASSW
ncbi:MAG: hypothetical protein ACFFFC_15885 [Candidatus Thorarchaeota archaeon]